MHLEDFQVRYWKGYFIYSNIHQKSINDLIYMTYKYLYSKKYKKLQ